MEERSLNRHSRYEFDFVARNLCTALSVFVSFQATTQNLSLITNRDEISMLVKSKAMTVKDVAAVGEKLCEIDVDSFSGSQLSPDVVGISLICYPIHTTCPT